MKYAFLILLTGCVAAGHLSTPSGKPEITVNAPRAKIQGACAAWLAQHGFTVDKQTDYSLTGLQNISNKLASDDDFFIERVFTFAPKGEATTIYSQWVSLDRNRAGGETQTVRDNQFVYDSLQSELTQIKGMIE